MQHQFSRFISSAPGADELHTLYNIAQAVTGPLLAASVNSPILLGKRLWHGKPDRGIRALHRWPAPKRMRSPRPQAQGFISAITGSMSSVIEIFQRGTSHALGSFLDGDRVSRMIRSYRWHRGEAPKHSMPCVCHQRGPCIRWKNRACYGISDNGKYRIFAPRTGLFRGRGGPPPTVLDEDRQFGPPPSSSA